MWQNYSYNNSNLKTNIQTKNTTSNKSCSLALANEIKESHEGNDVASNIEALKKKSNHASLRWRNHSSMELVNKEKHRA